MPRSWRVSSLALVWLCLTVSAQAQTTDAFNYSANSNIEVSSGGIWKSVIGSVDTTGTDVNGPAPDSDRAVYAEAVVNFPDDQYSQLEIKGFGTGGLIGVLLRASEETVGNADFIEVRCDADDCDLVEVNDGVETNIQLDVAVSLAVNDVIKAGVAGTTVQLFKNGAQFGSNYTITRTTGQPGFNLWSGASADNWEGSSFSIAAGGGPRVGSSAAQGGGR